MAISIYDSTFILVYCVAVALIFGACMGSFLNCTAIRIVKGEAFVKGRSHCVSCGHDLSWMDLIPVVSWVSLGGKCRYCGAKVSARYPITEVAFALLSAACLLKFDLTVLCLRNYIFLAILFLLTLTDMDSMEIPDSCHIIMTAAWVATAPFIYGTVGNAAGKGAGGWPEIWMHVAAAVVFGGGLLAISLMMDHIMKRDTLGGGDIKLIAVIGLYSGFIGTLFVLILSCILGLGFNTYLMKKRDNKIEFPFGPWIAAAAAVILFVGDPLISWYSGLIR